MRTSVHVPACACSGAAVPSAEAGAGITVGWQAGSPELGADEDDEVEEAEGDGDIKEEEGDEEEEDEPTRACSRPCACPGKDLLQRLSMGAAGALLRACAFKSLRCFLVRRGGLLLFPPRLRLPAEIKRPAHGHHV